jgi:hypothetical protein
MKNKKLIITESQYRYLIDQKRKEKKVYESIVKDIDQVKSILNESILLNEAVTDVLSSYLKKGLLTVGIIASLLSSNIVNAQQLQKAGVEKTKIEQAQTQSTKEDDMSNNAIERRIVRNLKSKGADAALKRYQSLSSQEKETAYDLFRDQLKRGVDDDKIIIDVTGYVNKVSGGNYKEISSKKMGEKISVDTAYVKVSLPIGAMFESNSAELSDPTAMQKMLKDSLNTFMIVDEIIVEASSSTLRNTGGFENMTWKESSSERANSVSELLIGMKYDLGGEGVNEQHTITSETIKLDINGTNGDGSSGPQSPYEVNPNTVQSYKERGIDAKFWDSASEKTPIANVGDGAKEIAAKYKEYQYVNIVIKGRMVITETTDIINYKYVKALVEKDGGDIKIERDGGKADISSCPVMIKTK